LIQHFPWLPSLNVYYSNIASKSPIDFLSEVFTGENSEEIYDRILGFFKAAFQNLEEFTNYKIDQLNVYLYLILKIFLYILDNKMITNRIANLYSKINYDELLKEIDKQKYFNIYEICEDINLEIQYKETVWEFGRIILKDQETVLKTKFKIHYIAYLKLAIHLKDDYRKLVNNTLSNGFVLIEEKRLARLLQEYVRNRFIVDQETNKSSIDAFKREALKVQKFKELYDTIQEEWTKKEEKFEYTFNFDFEKIKDISTIYPPCILEILKKAKEGQNLVHNERLFIVWFLIALKYPVDKIIDIFSSIPDFNREKTEYQVNFAVKKAYTPYKCSSLKSLNLCLAEKYKDELCLEGYGSKEKSERKKVSHPLSYVNIKQYRATKKNIKYNQNNKNE
jgi:DNA primase large subunit